jgi:hypothetical protein
MLTGVLQPLPDVDKTGMVQLMSQLPAVLETVTYTKDETVLLISPH